MMEEAATVPLEDYQRLVHKYNELHMRYRDLQRIHSQCGPYVKEANQKYQAAKESARLWQAWIDHQTKKNDPASSEHTSPSKNKSGFKHVSSSQTTEGDPDSLDQAQDESSSDDEPQIVSERIVRKPRRGSAQAMPPPVRIKQEPTSTTQPIELTSDDHSSPVLKRKRLVRTETSNLDAITGHIDTPRKRKYTRASSEEAARPAFLLHGTSSLSEGDVPITNDSGERNNEGNGPDNVATFDFALEPKERVGNNAVLRERDPNVGTASSNTALRSNMKHKRTPKANAVAVSMLSEDGEDLSSQVAAPHRESETGTNIHSRLKTLLDVPSPVGQPIPKRRTPETHAGQRAQRISPPVKREPDVANDITPKVTATFKRPCGLEKSPPPPQPEDEPLRQRPLGSLRLDDFRINTQYMGADYAFADTLRGRDQRRCLQGCTRPECCGDAFRKAVEMGGLRSGKSDAQVLEEYLGPDFATIMGAYAPDKRNEMLIRAHAQAFANEHGKHRHAFARRSTPPGFWRTDMPTTQEAAEDRAKAQELERQKVEERWLEARREGGRWLFRDES